MLYLFREDDRFIKEIDLNFVDPSASFLNFGQIEHEGLAEVVEVGNHLEVLVELEVDLRKQVDFYQVQIIVQFLLLQPHGMSPFLEIAEVQHELVLEVDVGHSTITLKQFGFMLVVFVDCAGPRDSPFCPFVQRVIYRDLIGHRIQILIEADFHLGCGGGVGLFLEQVLRKFK